MKLNYFLQLQDENKSKEYYEKKFSSNYMSDWPVEKKLRVLEVIKELPLPKIGRALDFGCGNGVFTEILKDALPEWEIVGCDIAEVAIANAKKRYPFLRFFILSDEQKGKNDFDFLFSHHVLEHVPSITRTVEVMNSYLKDSSSMLHIFPCRNDSSYEYNICDMRTDGINYKLGKRFFFEDEGHLRRLNTDETMKIFCPYNFELKIDFYCNQYFGALEWISRSSYKFIIDFTNLSKGKNLVCKLNLLIERIKLLILYYTRWILKTDEKLRNHKKNKLKHKMALIFLWFFSHLFYFIYNEFLKKAKLEWELYKREKNGSEMYLFFQRDN